MKQRLKLLFVVENRRYGGSERTFSRLIQGLPKEKFGVYCAGIPAGRFYEEVKEHCRFLSLETDCPLNLLNIGRLRDMISDNGIDLIHSRGQCASFFCAMAAGKGGIKLVSTLDPLTSGVNSGPAGRLCSALLNALAAGRTAAAVTVSQGMAAGLRGKYGAVEIIPNPVDTEEFNPCNFNAAPVIERYGLRGRTVISALGRLEHDKGYSCLLSALGLAVGQEPGLKERLVCLLAGSGSLENKLKQQVSDAGLSGNVVFCGDISGVRDFLAASDVFVAPHLSGGQPLALLEAMAMEKPVVGSDLPGIRETAEKGVEALLVPPAAPAELAEALLKILRDMPSALAMGRRARQKAKDYSLSNFLRRHEELYTGMIAAGAR